MYVCLLVRCVLFWMNIFTASICVTFCCCWCNFPSYFSSSSSHSPFTSTFCVLNSQKATIVKTQSKTQNLQSEWRAMILNRALGVAGTWIVQLSFPFSFRWLHRHFTWIHRKFRAWISFPFRSLSFILSPLSARRIKSIKTESNCLSVNKRKCLHRFCWQLAEQNTQKGWKSEIMFSFWIIIISFFSVGLFQNFLLFLNSFFSNNNKKQLQSFRIVCKILAWIVALIDSSIL